ncbi:MAG: peptidylprolyl isomerase [Isosphaera sp.]|nr:peptidylprolyl isomerase [Isosphaera sp.]
MSTTQVGDRVRAHYTKRLANGVVRSSRARGGAPLEVTVGSPHPRLAGLGSRLVGVAEGQTVTAHVPAEEAFGAHDPARVRRVDRARFARDEPLVVGGQARMRLGGGRTRPVRVVEVLDRVVVVDTNHPWCGQSVELEVELVAILAPAGGA